MTNQTPPVGQGSVVTVPRELLAEAEGLLWLEGYEATAQLLNDLAAAAPHPDPVPPVVGWQDISTAPRDDTFVLLLGERCGEPWAVAAFWSEEYRDWYTGEAASSSVTAFGDEPTHWMPLPAPPAETVSPGMEAEGRNEPNPNTTAGDRT